MCAQSVVSSLAMQTTAVPALAPPECMRFAIVTEVYPVPTERVRRELLGQRHHSHDECERLRQLVCAPPPRGGGHRSAGVLFITVHCLFAA